jgi:CRISPR/Cas system CMR-associated protein Cmr1 (group 7 of RAMP superfamily)
MDDFLHNLRSGNLKQPDRSRRQYQDQHYKGPQRRHGGDRRNKDANSAANAENLSAIKGALENIAETHRRMANAHESRSIAEERKAEAIEAIADSFEEFVKGKKVPKKIPEIPSDRIEDPEQFQKADKLDQAGRDQAAKLVCELRAQGVSYARIASKMEQMEIPTLSGRGKWRGQTVQRLYRQSVAADE